MSAPTDGFVDLTRPPAPRTLPTACLPCCHRSPGRVWPVSPWPRSARSWGCSCFGHARRRPTPSCRCPGPRPPSASPVATTATSLGPLVVDVVGEVRQPGVQRVPTGARIADVVAAAGGLTDRADRARINFAAPVADGERVFVPAVGQPVPAVAVGATPSGVAGSGAPGTGGGGTGGGGTPAVPAAPVNLNTATLEELDTLPGIGPTTAQAIIDHRTEHGPFTSVDQLLDVRGIGDAKLAELRDRVTV